MELEDRRRDLRVSAIAFLSPTSFVALQSDTIWLSGDVNKWYFQQFLRLFDISIGIEPAVTLELGPEFRRSPEFDLVSQSTSTDTPNIPGDVPISPFIQDETAERVIVLHDWTGRGYSFVLVRPLLRILEERIRSPPLKIDYLSWNEWGPGTVYTIYTNGVHVGPSSVFGSRIGISCPREYLSHESDQLEKRDAESLTYSDSDSIDNRSNVQEGEEAYPDDEVEGARAIAVLDLNPRPVIRALSQHVTPEDDDHADSQRALETFVKRTSFTSGIPVAHLCFLVGGSKGEDFGEVAMHEDHMIITKDGYYPELLQFGQDDSE
ncbi:hypothetical protein FRC17_010474 [Serendipita sp. 399]|nr:hypothetical protein FRC17_010474 [Serendipita sp. 399]